MSLVPRRYVAVVGPAACTQEEEGLAAEVGRLLAQADAAVVCGGLGGVMAAACRGAASSGGLTIGLLPGEDRSEANQWVGVAIPTGLGEARNALVARVADAMIAVGGGFGTLSEIAFALKLGRPVVGIGTWSLSAEGLGPDPILRVAEPEEAVRLVLERIGPR